MTSDVAAKAAADAKLPEAPAEPYVPATTAAAAAVEAPACSVNIGKAAVRKHADLAPALVPAPAAAELLERANSSGMRASAAALLCLDGPALAAAPPAAGPPSCALSVPSGSGAPCSSSVSLGTANGASTSIRHGAAAASAAPTCGVLGYPATTSDGALHLDATSAALFHAILSAHIVGPGSPVLRSAVLEEPQLPPDCNMPLVASSPVHARVPVLPAAALPGFGIMLPVGSTGGASGMYDSIITAG